MHVAGYTHRVQARVQVHGLARGDQGETLLPLKLDKEVEGGIVMSVGGNATPPNPQIDLRGCNFYHYR